MKVRIQFPEDIAKEKAEEAKNWEPGQTMAWECEDYHTAENITREGDEIVIKTSHTRVWLNKEEIEKIKQL